MKKRANNKKPIKLSGLVIPFNEKDLNGRIYSEDSFSSEVIEEMNLDIKNGTMFGELGQTSNGSITNLHNVSHIVTRAEVTNKGIIAEIEILDTPSGKKLQHMVEIMKRGGDGLGIASKSSGRVNENGSITIDHIYSYDIVMDPTFKSARVFSEEEKLNKLDDLNN